MRIGIYIDEMYPYAGVTRPDTVSADWSGEVSEERLQAWRDAEATFKAAQQEMLDLTGWPN